MSRTLAGLALAACALGTTTAYAGDVNVGVTISGEIQPGVYGRIDLGNRPPPAVVYEQPVWVAQPPQHVYVEPVYMHVPPGHARNWRKYCGRYHACDRPVYFVRSSEYGPPPPPAPPRVGRGYDDRRDDGRGHGRGPDRNEGDGPGRGHDNGRGHGHDQNR